MDNSNNSKGWVDFETLDSSLQEQITERITAAIQINLRGCVYDK